MKRPWLTWMLFGLCLVVVLLAMGWISAAVLRLEAREAEARRRAEVEEIVRWALWRMDSSLAPFLAQEAARPHSAYSAFCPPDRSFNVNFREIPYGQVLVPSPLFVQTFPRILLHFQFAPDGNISSPQVLSGDLLRLTEQGRELAARSRSAQQRLREFQKLVGRDALAAALPQPVPALAAQDNSKAATQAAQANTAVPEANFWQYGNNGANSLAGRIAINDFSAFTPEGQAQRGRADFMARNSVSQQAFDINNYNRDQQAIAPNIVEGPMRCLWIGQALVLARRVVVDGQTHVEGCWLDWTAIRKWLTDSISDLLPEASVEPMAGGFDERQPRLLAALPARLLPGTVRVSAAGPASPARLMLAVAWICAGAAAVAVAVLLQGVMALSERRASFVSAVTHELRTPLTTLRMYTEMLAGGMVPEESRRTGYLQTLRVEADRLGHLVENVLAYSRLERNANGGRMQTLTVGELVERVRQRLADRAEQAGMTLLVEGGDEAMAATVRIDVLAAEQVLFNLVDNACKYAAAGTEKTIHLQASASGSRAMLRVRDHGPGFGPRESRRLFRPFSKSVHEAANSAPGLGLGLALSQRLARNMRGELRLDREVTDGACFEFAMPRA